MRGRYALGEAYRLSGVVAGVTLMAPAYHCVTMLDPALALGADILLYPLSADLSPDLSAFDTLLAQANSPVKALLATHFFGLIQDFAQLKTWCNAKGIVLIEDCSHVLFSEAYQATGSGRFGKFVTSSPYKFFSCEDGGLLYAPLPGMLEDVHTEPRTLLDELRGIKHTLEKRRSNTPPVPTDSEYASPPPLSQTHSELPITEYCQPSPYFVVTDKQKSALRFSRWIARKESIKTIVAGRRKNYTQWARIVTTLPNCRALYPQLPETCVPYMFPLLIDQPELHFHWLKQLGMPIWRWDELALSECAISRRYQLHLLHLPCHQSLNESQMNWMIRTLSAVVKHPIIGID